MKWGVGSLAIFLFVWATVVDAESLRVTLVDGVELDATALEFSVDGSELRIGERSVVLNNVRWIAPTAATPTTPTPRRPVRLWLDGGQLIAGEIAIQKNEVSITRRHGESWTLPFELLRAAWWSPISPPPAFTAALAAPHAEHDRLLLMVNGMPTLIDGYLEVVAEQVRLEWMDQVRNVSREVCLGFVAARAADGDDSSPKLTIHLRDGSRIPAARLSVNDEELVCRVTADVEWPITWSEVERIGVSSNRLRFLSDDAPVDVRSETLVALPRSWQADRTVTGRSLPTPSARGIGMQAGTWLTFEIAAEEAVQFAVDVGLDPITGKTGDCEAVIRGDGRELNRKRLRGGEPATAIRVDVRGVAKLEIGVEPGENLDLNDHVNWCDARLIRPAVER